MGKFLILKSAQFRLDEIYQYNLNRWGKEQAEIYIEGLFEAFSQVSDNEVLSRPIPAEFVIKGFYFKYKKHFVYWKYLASDQVGIVTILHQRMHQMRQFDDIQRL